MGLNRSSVGITSPVKIIANIFVSFIGAGMLGLPFAFKEAGVMEGALIMATVGYLSVAAMLMLIDCKYAILSSGGRAGGRSIIMDTKVPLIPPDSSDDEDEDERHPPTPSTDLTYGDVGLYAFGPGGKRLVDITIVISQIGFCCGYLIYLGKTLNLYIPYISQRSWLIMLMPPLFSLTLLRHLNKLAIFSLFAQVSNVFALAVVFWFDFSHSEKVPVRLQEFSLYGFPFFFAVSIYCYEGAGMILSLEESVAESKREKFRSIFICTMAGLTTLYICFGVSGYASFGHNTMDIITLNLPHGEGSVVDFAAMVKICLGIALFFTYPMMMFPVTHLLDKTLGFTNVPFKGNILRLILVVVTGLVVVAVPNFAILMGLIGATCCTLLAFILPAAFHLSIFKNRLTKRQWYFDALLIFLGVTGSIIGVWDALNRMNGHDLLEVDEFSPSGTRNKTFPQVAPLGSFSDASNLNSPINNAIEDATKKYENKPQVLPAKSTITTKSTTVKSKLDTSQVPSAKLDTQPKEPSVSNLPHPQEVNIENNADNNFDISSKVDPLVETDNSSDVSRKVDPIDASTLNVSKTNVEEISVFENNTPNKSDIVSSQVTEGNDTVNAIQDNTTDVRSSKETDKDQEKTDQNLDTITDIEDSSSEKEEVPSKNIETSSSEET